ncbi:MAG TPA: acetylglutamate kinase [Salinimicrobium sp.]|nr:acetylglutamate kinase [Salinimicrobium sp.]
MKNEIIKVIKIGGKIIEDEDKLQSFLKDFSAIKSPKILVHGGGKLASEIGEKLGHQTKMIDGRRITDANALKTITMVYGGLINKTLVAKLQRLGCNAIGLCGADGQSIISKKRPVKEIDYGLVGDIEKVNTQFIFLLLDQNLIPVFSAISYSEQDGLLNTNGDSIASEIAVQLGKSAKTELYFCSEKKGVLADVNDDSSVVPSLDFMKYENLLKEKRINEGMLPKLHNCFQALKNGVSTVYLGDFTLLQSKSVHTKIVQ